MQGAKLALWQAVEQPTQPAEITAVRPRNYASLAAFIDPRFENDALLVTREIQLTNDVFIHLVLRFKFEGSRAHTAAAPSIIRAEASSGIVLRFREPDSGEKVLKIKQSLHGERGWKNIALFHLVEGDS